MVRRAMLVVLVVVVLTACGKRADAPPASWEPDRSCASNDDCTPAPSCCPAPCSGDVINKRDVAKMQKRVDATCNKDDCKNVVAGSCAAHAYLCVRGRCAMVTEGSPDWPEAGAAK
jgi:hypothetical protein